MGRGEEAAREGGGARTTRGQERGAQRAGRSHQAGGEHGYELTRALVGQAEPRDQGDQRRVERMEVCLEGVRPAPLAQRPGQGQLDGPVGDEGVGPTGDEDPESEGDETAQGAGPGGDPPEGR